MLTQGIVLEALDRSGVPACLETSAAGNVKFYESLGFTVLSYLDELPAGALAGIESSRVTRDASARGQQSMEAMAKPVAAPHPAPVRLPVMALEAG